MFMWALTAVPGYAHSTLPLSADTMMRVRSRCCVNGQFVLPVGGR